MEGKQMCAPLLFYKQLASSMSSFSRLRMWHSYVILCSMSVVRISSLKQAVLNKTFVMYQDKYRHNVVQTLPFTYSM